MENSESTKNSSVAENTSPENSNTKPTEAEILNNMPPEMRKVIEMSLSMQRYTGPAPNPLFEKITPAHIDKILEIADKDENNSFKDAQSTKTYSLIYFILILVFLGGLILYLTDRNSGLLMSIIEKGLYVIGGFGGGYGFKAYLDNKKK